MKYLWILLLIAVIVSIGMVVARSRSSEADALPAGDHPDALAPRAPDDTGTAAAAPQDDITAGAASSRPLDPEPEPDVEPLPEPDPVIEPEDPQPAEPEPVVEPDTAAVGSPAHDHPAADPDEPTDPPRAVIDAGEVAAKELDPEAGWESDDGTKVHADPESGLYHTPDSPGYKLGPDGQVFESEDAAQTAGFTRWDQPR